MADGINVQLLARDRGENNVAATHGVCVAGGRVRTGVYDQRIPGARRAGAGDFTLEPVAKTHKRTAAVWPGRDRGCGTGKRPVGTGNLSSATGLLALFLLGRAYPAFCTGGCPT